MLMIEGGRSCGKQEIFGQIQMLRDLGITEEDVEHIIEAACHVAVSLADFIQTVLDEIMSALSKVIPLVDFQLLEDMAELAEYTEVISPKKKHRRPPKCLHRIKKTNPYWLRPMRMARSCC